MFIKNNAVRYWPYLSIVFLRFDMKFAGKRVTISELIVTLINLDEVSSQKSCLRGGKMPQCIKALAINPEDLRSVLQVCR